MAGKVSCRSGKTVLVDPNDFYGQDSSSNMSIPNEDLNITVELTTTKKARTILTSTTSGSAVYGNNIESDAVKVSFIDASIINGKKELTTYYTDLTTSFDKGNNGESLGITNIDIDFNSSYAPLITINFIDVRGSAIYQNEVNSATDKNKYSVFFQLPYPIYNLTIKGYYGQPVSYCLHMTKYSSRFNSQTGNFEITANYIGYTYALLSDMLIGYLKAIPYTKKGAKLFKELQYSDPSLITLDVLAQRINRINDLTKKIKATDPNQKDLMTYNSKGEFLIGLKTALTNLGSRLSRGIDTKSNDTLNEYKYVPVNYIKSTEVESVQPSTINGNQPQSLTIPNNDYDINTAISDFKTRVSELLSNYNNDNYFKIKVDEFINLTKIDNITLTTLNPYDANNNEKINNDIYVKFGSPTNYLNNQVFDEKRKQVLNYLTANYSIGPTKPISVYDLTSQYDLIKTNEELINNKISELRKKLGKEMQAAIASDEGIGFDPSIRNMVKIFCAHVEVFLRVIAEVSSDTIGHTERTNELEKKFNTNNKSYDILDKDIQKSGDNVGNLTPNYYPWPEYRKGDAIDGLTETYLGQYGELTHPEYVDELFFIDDLLQAFITSSKVQDDILNNISDSETNWYPINPIDTRPFIKTQPYKRVGDNVDAIINLMVIRGMTYLGYSNKELTKPEIQAMATFEANAVLKSFSDDNQNTIVQLLTQAKLKDFTGATGTINGIRTNIIVKKITQSNNILSNYTSAYDEAAIYNQSDNIPTPLSSNLSNSGVYRYNYIFSGSTNSSINVLPLSSDFKGIWNPNSLYEYANDNGRIFLTNYSNDSNSTDAKDDDGGVYVKILTYEYDLDLNSKTLVEVPPENTSVLNLEKLKAEKLDKETVGFNQFGGQYGIQEYKILDYGGDIGLSLPLKYVFYDESYHNGLSDTRAISGPSNDKNTIKTPYDITENETVTIPKNSDIFGNLVPNTKNHGSNRALFKKFLTQQEKQNEITYPLINFTITSTLDNLQPKISLFGSHFYYGQSESKFPNQSKGLLFLHSLPWNGFTNTTNIHDPEISYVNGLFNSNEIRNLFSNRAGFITVPRLWAAFLGGMLWRASSEDSGQEDPIIFRENNNNLIPTGNNISAIPTRSQFLKVKDTNDSISFTSDDDAEYLYIDETLRDLPLQIKKEFKQTFIDFIDTDWNIIKENLELSDNNSADWVAKFNIIQYGVNLDVNNNYSINTSLLINTYKNFDKYIVLTPLAPIQFDTTQTASNARYDNNLFLELKGGYGDNIAIKAIIDNLNKEVIIANSNYKVWQKPEANIGNYLPIEASVGDVEDYFKAILDVFKNNKDALKPDEKKIEREQKLFGTSDENVIKFNLYRTIKGIYDKWIAGSDGENLFFQCGNYNSTDEALANKRGVTRSLIDTFRFVTRSFKDIGDDFIINPLPINTFLLENNNSSFYDAVTSLLNANKFDFIPLPSYINYNDEKTLASMFEPVRFADALDKGISGPSFVCVYIGQSSKYLDMKGDSNYPNDGFDVRCNNLSSLPLDFTLTSESYENDVAVFAVNYGQQNQNIFKDIILDQNEFTETNESLQIVDKISKKGAETNKELAGQNIFNVYSVRSYKVEVEMLGNAMVQPMMYFQLNNIPMFHGAYLITHVKHSIKPNFMSTNFTGVRVRKPLTPLIDVSALYMSMLDSLTDVDVVTSSTGGGGGTTSGKLAPIVTTIYDNGGRNGDLIHGNITTNKIEDVDGIKLNITDTNTNLLITEALAPLNKMLTDWVSWMTENGFKGENKEGKTYAYINSAYRTYEQQVATKAKAVRDGCPKCAASPGSSNHGWGIAIDIQTFTKEGQIISIYNGGEPNIKEGYNLYINESLVWLLKNSYKYGWIIPKDLRDGSGLEEFWHFEYHGTAAKCILDEQRRISSIVVDTTDPILDIVKNPKDINNNNKEAYYTKCTYKTKKQMDGTIPGYTNSNKNIIITPPSNDDIGFYSKVLNGIGATPKVENMKFLYAWRQAEHGNASFNPFNTTLTLGNVTNYNCNDSGGRPFPVKNYETRENGIKATIDTLLNGKYPLIVYGLVNDKTADEISRLQELNTWGSGYLVNKILAGQHLTPPPIKSIFDKVGVQCNA